MIHNSLLSNTDSYFNEEKAAGGEIVQSQIECKFALSTVFLNSIKQPEHNKRQKEYRSSSLQMSDFDFQFEEEKVFKRPKTPPKKKKFYEQN